MDRIDLQIETQTLSIDDMTSAPTGEPSAVIRERVVKARKRQEERFRGQKGIPVFRNGVTQIEGYGFTPIASNSFVTSSS